MRIRNFFKKHKKNVLITNIWVALYIIFNKIYDLFFIIKRQINHIELKQLNSYKPGQMSRAFITQLKHINQIWILRVVKQGNKNNK